jgi:lipid-A-disaccharide synthase
MKRIAVVAGEASGDALGGELIRALKRRYPGARFDGIGGPAMCRQGLLSFYPMDTLSVMGLTEVVRHLPRLWRVRRELIRHYRANPPDLFVGIDSPDFNLGLARALKQSVIPTAHYVSPTVWAWRQGRIKGIARSVNHMLTLLPFEASFYEEHGVPVTFVGHPAADRFALETDVGGYRSALGLEHSQRVLTVLPGSRTGEIERLGTAFMAAAAELQRRLPGLRVLVPVARPGLRPAIEGAVQRAGLDARLIDDGSERAMGAADAILTKSGTATLEAMLLKKPMVVGYRVAAPTAWLVRRLGLLRVTHFALPNLLAGRLVVPEFIQEAVEPGALADALERLLTDGHLAADLRACFTEQHQRLRRGASDRAAETLAGLIE